MTIPQKGSRRLVVDGVLYRWRIRHKPTYAMAIAESGMTVAVQHAGGGQVLHLSLSANRPDCWIAADDVAVTPAMIARWIRDARARGWNPTADGPALELAVD